MIPLETNQRVLTWFFSCSLNKFDNKRKQIGSFLISLSIIVIHFLAMMAGVIFISKFIFTNLEDAIFAAFHTIAAFSMLYQSTVTVLLRCKLTAIFKSLSKLYQQNENGDSYSILVQTNKQCEWIWSFFIKHVMGLIFIITVITIVGSVIFSYIKNGYFNVNDAYHGIKLTLPWNQSTLLGYSLEVCFDTCAKEAFLLTNGVIIILFISMSLNHRAFYKIFQNEVRKLDFHLRTRNEAEHIRKLICLHISFKDWFLETAEVFSSFIMVALISSMLFLACAVFQLDQQMKHPDFTMIAMITAIPVGLSILFLYCYFGKCATESYAKMSECLYEFNWQDLSAEHQKYFIIMIQNTQKPIYYHGFGIVVLNLETFTTMIHAVFSYYMIFKTLTSD